MDTNFDKCLAFTLKEEGGNDDDPNDHGGRTSRGITQREWDAYRTAEIDRPEDVWKASDTDVRAIYHDKYWEPHCPQLPTGLDLCFFDFAVNAGPGQAIKKLQVTLNIPSDGEWGSQTEAAVKSTPVTPKLINDFCDAREAFYKGLAQFSRYGKGWTSRNERCRQVALGMLGVSSSPKANPAQTKINTNTGPGSAAVIVGGAGTVAVATGFHSPLIFLGIIGVAIVAGVIIHSIINRKVT